MSNHAGSFSRRAIAFLDFVLSGVMLDGIGMLDGRVVIVVFTEPDEQTIRIISLRKALPYERKRYEQYLRDELGQG